VTGRHSALALILVALVMASCTALLGDGQYYVVQDAATGDGNGDDSGSSSGADTGSGSGADGQGGDSGTCTPGTQQCLGASVETCGATGRFGAPSPCASGTCNGGACTGSTTAGPSCAVSGDGGIPDAGATGCGSAGESCCTSIEVPGGTYFRTYTNTGTGPTGDQDPATVSGLRLDKYLVTVGRFRQFVSALNGSYQPPPASGKHTHLNGGQGVVNSGSDAGVTYETGWVASDDSNVAPTDANLACGTPAAYATWTPSVGTHENLPINCINWWEAYAFCIWDGGFLPTEAEWENVAAAGSQQREYPWGSAAPGMSNAYAIYGGDAGTCLYPTPGACSGVANIAPVGTATMGASLFGQLDVAGDAWEWNLDWSAGYVDPCTDCGFLTTAVLRVARGGAFAEDITRLPASFRNGFAPTSRSSAVGVRCARIP
jgi:formylglycine-generating enzyme required for sulfatase activity